MLIAQQLADIRDAILADEVLAAKPQGSDGAFIIAAALNLPSDPVFTVWRTDMTAAEVMKALVWTEFIERTAGERDALKLMIKNNILNTADANVRTGFQDIFSGVSGATTRANLIAAAKRSASRIEKILSVGEGTEGTPAIMGFEGVVCHQDIGHARRS